MRRIAIWNGSREAWESPLGSIDLFSTHSDVYLETWPSSGTWDGGSAFELPMPELPTVATASSFLPTPMASDGEKGGPNQRGGSGDLRLSSAVQVFPTPRASRGASGTETMYRLGAERSDENGPQGQVLMPTPRTSDTNGPGSHGTGGPDLRTVVSLLPTPVASEGTKAHDVAGQRGEGADGAGVVDERGARSGDLEWGVYQPAIARWEAVTGRVAPSPTNSDGRDGSHRLAAEFVEWMMGLPAGHVTDPAIGLTRNDQLKALGNGVVWQQAALALSILLGSLPHITSTGETNG